MLIVYIYLCPAQFSRQMMFMLLNSMRTGVTCGAGTAYPSRAPEFTPSFEVHVARSLVFCVMFCRSLFVLLSYFIWPLCCLFFDWRLLITCLISSYISYRHVHCITITVILFSTLQNDLVLCNKIYALTFNSFTTLLFYNFLTTITTETLNIL